MTPAIVLPMLDTSQNGKRAATNSLCFATKGFHLSDFLKQSRHNIQYICILAGSSTTWRKPWEIQTHLPEWGFHVIPKPIMPAALCKMKILRLFSYKGYNFYPLEYKVILSPSWLECPQPESVNLCFPLAYLLDSVSIAILKFTLQIHISYPELLPRHQDTAKDKSVVREVAVLLG